MSNLMKRYEKLGFKQALTKIHHFPTACTELSFILKEAYGKLPKNLQSIIFQDTLQAFLLLPRMGTRNCVSAANFLAQRAESALPKQKKNLVAKEFRKALVAVKRRPKTHQDDESATELPHDVLMHIFSFLDIKSLVSVGQVCWYWNSAAINSKLWESQYAIFFGDKHNSLKTRIGIDWREAFKKAYKGNLSKRLASDRGFCDQCETIVWVDNMKCCNKDHGAKSRNWQIRPVSPNQVAEFLLNNSPSIVFSSDSDSDSEDGMICKLWAYPKHIGG